MGSRPHRSRWVAGAATRSGTRSPRNASPLVVVQSSAAPCAYCCCCRLFSILARYACATTRNRCASATAAQWPRPQLSRELADPRSCTSTHMASLLPQSRSRSGARQWPPSPQSQANPRACLSSRMSTASHATTSTRSPLPHSIAATQPPAPSHSPSLRHAATAAARLHSAHAPRRSCMLCRHTLMRRSA